MQPLVKRFLAASLVATASLAPGAEKLDLQRMTPVPASEPIPIQDFFRRPTLCNPQLNPSGTRLVAELVSSPETTSLVVLDLRTNATEVVNPPEGENFLRPLWLNDQVFISHRSGKSWPTEWGKSPAAILCSAIWITL